MFIDLDAPETKRILREIKSISEGCETVEELAQAYAELGVANAAKLGIAVSIDEHRATWLKTLASMRRRQQN